jgi:AcrR family transcriptional regulator
MARPRSVRAHLEVLEAAAHLFTERGIDATSMDAIAAASGVSKATIYKHWPNKDRLALEVLCHVHGLDEKQPVFDSGDVRADLIAQMTYQPAEDRTEMKERMMPHLMAYSVRHQEFGRAWRERVIDRQRSAIRVILEHGVKQRKLDRAMDLELGIALLFGPVLYAHIFLSPTKVMKPSPEFVERVVDAFLRAFSPGHRATAQPSRASIRSRS